MKVLPTFKKELKVYFPRSDSRLTIEPEKPEEDVPPLRRFQGWVKCLPRCVLQMFDVVIVGKHRQLLCRKMWHFLSFEDQRVEEGEGQK